jgi:hypothetical protein
MDFFRRRDEPATSDRSGGGSEDERAVERYRYMLSTAPPEDMEQRRQVLEGLSREVPESEIRGDDPRSLARTATRAEMREPGVLERTFQGPGLGSFFLYSLAGSFIGTAIAQQFFADDAGGDSGDGGDAGDSADSGDGGGDYGDGGGGDYAGADTAGAGDVGGGDFGGGDFGGGDFGGGDFGGF